MKSILIKFLLGLFLVLANDVVFAQITVVRGEANVTLASGEKNPSDTERASVYNTAKMTAWRSYLAMPGHDEIVDQIRANENLFLDQLDNLLVDVVIVEENYDKVTGRYEVRIKATVAEGVINSIIRNLAKGNSSGAGRGRVSALGSTPIMVLGMAREAATVKNFLEKQTLVAETSASDESNSMHRHAGGRTAESSIETGQAMVTSGGNRERKRDAITYKVGDVSMLNSKLPRILVKNGIKASPYAFVMRACHLPDPDKFSKQYADSADGELPSKVLGLIQDNLLSCGKVHYWVFASMDTGGYGTDPNTGLSLATVTVNVHLYEVDSGAEVASASKDVSGRSSDQTDAIREATENATQAVGDIITSQIATLGN
jgi:hypothetical protein